MSARTEPEPESQPEGFPSEEPTSGEPRFRVGELIGDRYELRQCIGVGAMGAVFRAQDRVLDAELAVKLIRLDPERGDNERATQRLLFEARAIARISHPGIVRVFDFGSAGGVPFIAMELLEGESLLDLMMREGPLVAERAVRMLLPIADALAVAHRRGVVHRDIKPENVFLAKDDFGRITPKLVDFGVARLGEGGSGMTRPGALMGTPDYMAPEQAYAEPDVDHRVDIWALAVLLYELITQQRPFSLGHSNYLTTLQTIVSEPPRPLSACGVDEASVWPILEKAMLKPREARYQSMREMGQALAQWLIDRGVLEDAYGASLVSTWLKPEHSSASDSAPASDRESITLRSVPGAAPAPLSSQASPAVPPATAPLQERAPRPITIRRRSRQRKSVTRASRAPVLVAALLAALIAGVTSGGLVWLSGAGARGPGPPVSAPP